MNAFGVRNSSLLLEGASACRRRREAYLALWAMIATGCGDALAGALDEYQEDYSIEADGQDLVAMRVDGTLYETDLVITDLENPPITGALRGRPIRRSDDASTCCVRAILRASDEVFLYSDPLDEAMSAIVSITEQAPVSRRPQDEGGRREEVVRYRTPAIGLPGDGSTVTLTLSVQERYLGEPAGEEVSISGSVRLDESVIVIPVHVHVFKRACCDVDYHLSPWHVRQWFDTPNIETRGLLVNNPFIEGDEYITTTRGPTGDPVSSPVDLVYRAAGIQFHLASYDVIENDELEQQIVRYSVARTLETAAVHRQYQEIPGLHVYIGRNAGNFAPSGQADGPGCSDRTESSNAVVLAWDYASTSTLAHEIGHFLGLEHVQDGPAACGSALLDGLEPSDNLMHPVARDRRTELSASQGERARAIACRHFERWLQLDASITMPSACRG